MTYYDSLIRLHRWQLDERRRDLAALEELGFRETELHLLAERLTGTHEPTIHAPMPAQADGSG